MEAESEKKQMQITEQQYFALLVAHRDALNDLFRLLDAHRKVLIKLDWPRSQQQIEKQMIQIQPKLQKVGQAVDERRVLTFSQKNDHD